MYDAEAFYSGVHDWTHTTPASRQLSVAISSDMLDLIPSFTSWMFLKNERLLSYEIAMLYFLLTYLNLSSNENILLAISDVTRTEM